jgi:hypothetical protein
VQIVNVDEKGELIDVEEEEDAQTQRPYPSLMMSVLNRAQRSRDQNYRSYLKQINSKKNRNRNFNMKNHDLKQSFIRIKTSHIVLTFSLI